MKCSRSFTVPFRLVLILPRVELLVAKTNGSLSLRCAVFRVVASAYQSAGVLNRRPVAQSFNF
jgi:hypothetical protein